MRTRISSYGSIKRRIDENKCGVYSRAAFNNIFVCNCGAYSKAAFNRVNTVCDYQCFDLCFDLKMFFDLRMITLLFKFPLLFFVFIKDVYNIMYIIPLISNFTCIKF